MDHKKKLFNREEIRMKSLKSVLTKAFITISDETSGSIPTVLVKPFIAKWFLYVPLHLYPGAARSES